MKEIGVDELKKIQLDMLVEIHNFCIKNDIKYSLAYGTLLGAVRHKGYIPWDDDIDIMMTRPNYEKFMKSFSHSYLLAQCYEVNSEFPLNYGKVYDTRTVLQEALTMQWQNSIFVDVFCMDGVGSSVVEAQGICKRVRGIHNLLIIKQLAFRKSRSMLKNILLLVNKFVLLLVSYKFLLRQLIKINTKCGYEESLYLSDLSWGDPKLVLTKNLFEEYAYCTFEDNNFLCIKDTNSYLKKAYGDYMKLPPVEKQITHHSFKAWWKE